MEGEGARKVIWMGGCEHVGKPVLGGYQRFEAFMSEEIMWVCKKDWGA